MVGVAATEHDDPNEPWSREPADLAEHLTWARPALPLRWRVVSSMLVRHLETGPDRRTPWWLLLLVYGMIAMELLPYALSRLS